MIRTLVCAASPLERAGLASLVRADVRFELIGETSPAELERAVAALAADVVLEQRESGAFAARAATVSLIDDVRGAVGVAARVRDEFTPHAILSRDASSEEIGAAMVAVAAGLVVMQPRTPVMPAAESRRPRALGGLTSRESDVLVELARGAGNKTIAARLAISEHTVKFHIASIFAKLGVSSRTEAVAQGVRLGLVML